jgi:hypothetical protein
VTERDEKGYVIRAVDDPIGAALSPLIEAIFAATRDGSAERAAALSELMSSVDRIRLAMRPKPTLQ